MKKLYHITLEISAFICLIWAFYPLFFKKNLSDDTLIPIHYNFQGEVDGWGGPSSLWVQPIIALVVYILFFALARYPEKLNYPIKVTKENARSLYQLAINMLRYIKLVLLTLFAYGSNLSLGIAIGKNGDKNHYIIVMLVGLMFIIVLFYVLKMIKYKTDS